jgi:cell division protein FtsL
MKLTMADEKHSTTADQPTADYVIATVQQPTTAATTSKSRLTRKHVLIAVVSLTVTALVVTCVLVAVRMYTDNNIDILKYKMTMKDQNNENVTQDVSADANANIIQYHVVKDGIEAWILQDFDKNIQVSKVLTESSVGCYVIPLNRSLAADPNSIPSTTPKTDSKTPSVQLVYKVSENPISDITFLGRRPTDLCKNIPTYWMEPSCEDDQSVPPSTTTPATNGGGRQKRASICATCGGYSCACGCCGLVCGLFATSTYYYYYSNGYWICVYYMNYVSCNVSLRPYSCMYNGRNWYYP